MTSIGSLMRALHNALTSAWILALTTVFALFVGGCQTRSLVCSPSDFTGCVIDDVQVIGNDAVGDGEILEKIATAPTGGSFEGVPLLGAIDTLTVQYERFDRFVLERDLERIARIYRSRGYYNAVVRAGRVRRLDPHEPGTSNVTNMRLIVEIVVEEGLPVLVDEVKLVPQGGMPLGLGPYMAAVSSMSTMSKGDVFTEEAMDTVRAKISRALTDRGYAYATVTPSADVDVHTRKAIVRFAVTFGPLCTFGAVEIVGHGDLPLWQLRPALGIHEDRVYSTNRLEEAEVALAEYGVFGSISVEPQLDRTTQPPPTKVPIVIRVQKAYLGQVRLGGGIELGDQVAARGIAGWQHKNATGALDRFSIDGKLRGVAYPWRISTIGSGRVEFIPEVSVRVQYSLPFPGDPRGTLFAQSQASYGLERNHDSPSTLEEDAVVPVEILLEHRQGYQRKFFLSRLLLSLSHNLSYSSPFNLYFDEAAATSLLISYLDFYAQLDLRKNEAGKYDRVRTAKGVMLSADVQVAGFVLGGDANDVKIKPELRWYASLAKGVVLAGRVSMGFLFAENYGCTLDEPISVRYVLGGSPTTARCPNTADEENNIINRDIDILDKRGLFSGGPASNRGYGFNEIAPHRVVDDLGKRRADPDAIGGRTLWETSIELRFPIRGAWGGTTFIEASDVTAGFGQLRIDHPHVSTGVGVNYDSPIGPVRVDLGVRVPYLQVIGQESVEDCTNDLSTPDDAWRCRNLVIEEAEPSDFLGLPMALSIAIGNAF